MPDHDLLHSQLQGVTPPDSPTDEDPIEDKDLEPDPEELDGPKPDDDEGDGEEPKRPDENYYREMIRKAEEREERMLQLMERLADSQSSVPEPVKKSGDSLDDRSIAELETLRSQVPEENLPAFDAYLNKRRVQDEIDSRMTELEKRTEVKSARQRAGQEAVNRYPELADPTSDFAKQVNAKLKTLGRAYIDANPRAIVDVANEVAISTGRTFRSKPGGRRPKGSQSRKGSAPVDNESDQGKKFMSKEKAQAIADRMSRGMPAGKKFNVDKIVERANDYDSHRDLFIK